MQLHLPSIHIDGDLIFHFEFYYAAILNYVPLKTEYVQLAHY